MADELTTAADRTSQGSVVPLSLALLVGAAAGSVVVGMLALLYGTGLARFPPFDLADLLIRAAPGDIATWAIETFGRSAQRLILLAGVALWIALFAILGLLNRRGLPRRLGQVIGASLALPAVLLATWSEGDPGIGRTIWLVVAFAIPNGLGGHLLATWLNRLSAIERKSAGDATSDWLYRPGNVDRRELLQRAGISALAVGLGGSGAGWILRRAGAGTVDTAAATPFDQLAPIIDGTPIAVATPRSLPPFPDTFPVPPEVRPRLTPNDEFYVVDISTRDPNLPEDDWTLRITGLVEREITLTYADLLALPAVEQDGTLMCISFVYESDLISTTRWTGVPLRTVLERAGWRDGAIELICRGAGGYSDSIPLEKALQPDTLLAYGMNGETLPRSHGFPCRLYVPNIYGEKSVKWLQEIELVGYDYQGYWQERGWTDEAIVNITSFFDTPLGDVARDPSGIITCAGIAFAGSRGIERIELRVDDEDWQPAELEAYDPALVWQRWRFDWRPDSPGPHRLTIRAIDREGNVQIAEEAEPHPDGMTGYQTVTLEIIES